MKILIEDNGSEVELEIREYIHFANVVDELGDSKDHAVSQRVVNNLKFKNVIIPEGEFVLTKEHSSHTIITGFDIYISDELPIGTNFKIITDSQIVLPLTDTIYNDELIDGSSELTKIAENIWLLTSINTHGKLLNVETLNRLVESLGIKFSELDEQISDGHAISNEPNNRLERRLDGLYVRDRLDPDPVAYYLLSRG